jgi:hypothetical protein
VLRILLEHRGLVSAIVAAGVWSFGHLPFSFPATNDMLVIVAANTPHVHAAIRIAFSVLWFTSSFALSFVYIFLLQPRAGIERIALPRYPEPAHRSALFLVLGEIHKERKPNAIEQPHWLTIPRRALFTGIGIFGAVGSGKTTCCMYPFAEQLLAYRRDDHEQRIGALVLEVKGDFCYRVREILRKHGREDDYIELSLDCPYRYNPLYNGLEAYALAYGIASLLTNLFGRGKEPFWQQAYTNVVKFIVLLHQSVYGYVTLFDVYECAINPDLLSRRVAEGKALFEPGEFLLVDPHDYYNAPDLKAFPFDMDPTLDRMKVARSEEVEQQLNSLGVPYTTHGSPDTALQIDANRREQFEAVERWFHHDWVRIEPKLRTSIVEGISVFLSLFDDSPAVKRTFCPPKEC